MWTPPWRRPTCSVTAGTDVVWAGELTPAQCSRFPAGDFVGRGSFATAYAHVRSPKKVVKFTADENDARAANALRGKRLLGTVTVFDVARLKGQSAEGVVHGANLRSTGRRAGRPVFAVVTERVDPVVSSEWRTAMDVLGRVVHDNRERLSAAKGGAGFSIPFDVVGSAEDQCAGSGCRDRVRELVSALNEAGRAGIILTDVYAKNWGMRGERPVVLDFGISKQERRKKIRLAKAPG